MWAVAKKAINGTVGAGMKPLDEISLEQSSRIIYEIVRNCQISGIITSAVRVANISNSLEEYFAYETSEIESIVLPPEVKTIKEYAIVMCGGIEQLYLPHIEAVEPHAIMDCDRLTYIQFGKALKELEGYSISNNGNLKAIYYGGTKAEWEMVQKAENWDIGCVVLNKIVCVDGEIVHTPNDR